MRNAQKVIGVLDTEVVPLLRKCSLAGHAEYKTHNEVPKPPRTLHTKAWICTRLSFP
jgi:hypothetical protein